MAKTQPPRQRRGWRWVIYRVITGPRFPALRLLVWTALIPLVIYQPELKTSVTFLVMISIAAGIESSLTDWTTNWVFVAEESPHHGQ